MRQIGNRNRQDRLVNARQSRYGRIRSEESWRAAPGDDENYFYAITL
jgi:hypothetical protein